MLVAKLGRKHLGKGVELQRSMLRDMHDAYLAVYQAVQLFRPMGLCSAPVPEICATSLTSAPLTSIKLTLSLVYFARTQ